MLLTEPNDIFLNYALGLELVRKPEAFTEAENQFKKVLYLNANYIAALYQLGKLYESLQKNEEALSCFRNGLEKAKALKDNKAINEFGEAIFMLEE